MFYYPRYTSKKTDMIRQFDVWERQGFLTYTDTNVTDYRRITEDIL
jgi:phage terminase large subunit-like protein